MHRDKQEGALRKGEQREVEKGLFIYKVQAKLSTKNLPGAEKHLGTCMWKPSAPEV
jgi:hypothetical protein